MKNIKFTNFEKARYIIKIRKPHKKLYAEGICEYPNKEKLNRILISPYQSDHHVAETIIHEMLHAYLWYLPETKVTKLSRSIVRVMKDVGLKFKFER